MLNKWTKKSILYRGPDPYQLQSLIYWSLDEDLSFHKISFKSINNLLRYDGDKQTHIHTDRQTDRRYRITSATLLAEVKHSDRFIKESCRRSWVQHVYCMSRILLFSRQLNLFIHSFGIKDLTFKVQLYVVVLTGGCREKPIRPFSHCQYQ